jgi:hypothetical protein
VSKAGKGVTWEQSSLLPILPRSRHLPVASTDGRRTRNFNEIAVRLWTGCGAEPRWPGGVERCRIGNRWRLLVTYPSSRAEFRLSVSGLSCPRFRRILPYSLEATRDARGAAPRD